MQVSKAVISSKSILTTEWQKTFSRPAPSGCHTSFLDKAIAWQQQVMKHGGLTASERRRLLGESVSNTDSANIGTRLVRVWKGETHQVELSPI